MKNLSRHILAALLAAASFTPAASAGSTCTDNFHGTGSPASPDRWETLEAELPPFAAGEISKARQARLTEEESGYLEFLYRSMSLPDMAGYPFEYWLANVRESIKARKAVSWEIPEREFRHFVLPVRVNNEALDDFRTLYADTLRARVQGMTAEQAALEINHWCHEMATYAPSDARTLPPLATISAGLGRCGEESVLAVAALRAAGIPARQVYTPRWAHTDDNHAWVEVFVDGRWHFMGACEPEPVLDLAWFNAPVSRAMLLHTLAFGDYRGPEDVIRRTRSFTEINVIKSYIPTRRTTVRVLDTDGRPVPGAEVEFKIYNYAEFYTVAEAVSDGDGKAGLDTGCGDMLVWAHKDGRFGIARASGETTDIVLDHNTGDSFGLDFEIVPPPEDPIPSSATPEAVLRNTLRLAYEDSLRNARPKGNAAVLDAFRQKYPGAKAEELLGSLSSKDLVDVRADVLEDAMAHCPGEFVLYRDCPRVSYEPLLPYFREIGEGLPAGTAREIFAWTLANVEVDDSLNPQLIYIPPVTVWRTRTADSRSRDIFFVAACRSKGIEARIDSVTGKTQYREDGLWKDIRWTEETPETARYGEARATYSPVSWLGDPLYYRHFTLSRIEDGTASLLTFDESGESSWKGLLSEPRKLEEGYYMLTSGIRKADGSVSAHLEFFEVTQGASATVPLVLRHTAGEIAVIGNIDAEAAFIPEGIRAEDTAASAEPQTILSATGRGYFMLALVQDFSEPSIHALRQLASMPDVLDAWDRQIIVLGADEDGCRRIDGYLADVDNVHYGTDPDGRIRKMIADGCMIDSLRLPVVVIADSFGRVVYCSQGYNTSLSEQLKTVISRL